jgi:hypothetical protein
MGGGVVSVADAGRGVDVRVEDLDSAPAARLWTRVAALQPASASDVLTLRQINAGELQAGEAEALHSSRASLGKISGET